MNDSKPIATLSPTLLARKGGAKPAMRSQMAAVPNVSIGPEVYEDLGWNDLGTDQAASNDHDPRHGSDPYPFAAAPEPMGGVVRLAHESPDIPLLVRQHREVRHSVETRRRPFVDSGRRAAFTLRVDPERHLKLRLACTLRNCSAQQLVTDALDRLLEDLPDVAELAAQVTRTRN